MNLSENKLILIEDKIDSLDLQKKVRNKHKYIVKKLEVLKGYLIKEHSIVYPNFYTLIGIAIGTLFGMFLSIPLLILTSGFEYGASTIAIILPLIIGLGLGAYLGFRVGRVMDAKAASENRVLKDYHCVELKKRDINN